MLKLKAKAAKLEEQLRHLNMQHKMVGSQNTDAHARIVQKYALSSPIGC